MENFFKYSTMIAKEVIEYYSSNGGSVFCTLLDAMKAFDQVDYCKPFCF